MLVNINQGIKDKAISKLCSSTDPVTGKLIFPRLVPTPMRPLDVAHQYALDYTTPQTIKFYNKGIEKLSGEAFNGTLLLGKIFFLRMDARAAYRM